MRGLLAMPLCLALLATVPAVAQPLVLKLSHFLGPDSFFQRDFAEPWAKQLEARTDGAVKVEIYNAASPFGDVTKQATQVRDGTIDIALGLRGAEGDRFPRSSIIELPFVVHDALSGSRALWELCKDGKFGEEYQEYKVLALFVHNPGLIHTADKRVIAPDDLQDLRLRAPNNTVAAALQSLGATAVILQVNDVMPAVKDHRIDGIVTNWGNPLPDFNNYMKYHTDIAFYTSAFFVLMDRRRFENLPANIRTVIDALSGAPLVARFGLLWNKWDRPVRDGASGPDQEIIVPDEAVMQQWRAALQPFAEHYLRELVAAGFSDAAEVYAHLVSAQQR